MATDNFAYCCDNVNNNLDVFDITTNTFITSIPVGTNPQYCAIRPDNSEVWVTNLTGNSISVVNVLSNTITATITGFNAPHEIGFNVAGDTAYVLNTGTNSIIPVSVATHLLGTPITSAIGVITNMALNPAANSLIVVGGAGRTFQQIAIPSGTGSATFTAPFGGSAIGRPLGYNAAGTFAYWQDRLTPSIAVISVAGNNIVSTLTPSASPTGGNAFTPDNKFVYITGGNDIFIITVATNTITTTLTPTDSSKGISITGDGTQFVFTVNTLPNVDVYSLPGNTLSHTFTTFGASHLDVCTTPKSLAITVPKLFIPIKGVRDFRKQDLTTDFLAIERWANSFGAPHLFIPFKPPQSTDDFNANWMTIQIWGNQAASFAKATNAPLTIPRWSSGEARDLTANFLEIQAWANGL